MKLLVTSLCDCFVYDVEARECRPVPRPTRGSRKGYGISWTQDRAYLGWREPCEILEYDRQLKPTGRQCQPRDGHEFYNPQFEDRPAHGILCLEGHVIVASTGRDELVGFPVDTLEQAWAWKPQDTAQRVDSPRPKHYNTMFAATGELYVVCHMMGLRRPSEVWRFSRGEGLADLRLTGVFLCGIGAHNCFPVRKELAACDSMNGRVVRLEDQAVLYQTARGWITRGFSYGGEAGALGVSEIEPVRSLRSERRAQLHIWHGGPFEGPPEVHELPLGPICEVRCLDRPDAAHWPNQPLWGVA